MAANWVRSTTALPRAGASVEFVLVGRDASMRGTFSDGVFRSRWADYGIERVNAWCESDQSRAMASDLGQATLA